MNARHGQAHPRAGRWADDASDAGPLGGDFDDELRVQPYGYCERIRNLRTPGMSPVNLAWADEKGEMVQVEKKLT
jgi:hypothetical protein